MSEQRLTDAEIIKALKCCGSAMGNLCTLCPKFKELGDNCIETDLFNDALNLINRQKAEIEKKSKAIVKAAQEVVDLKIELQTMRNAANSYKAEFEKLKGSKSTRLKDIESTISGFWTGLEKLSMFKGKDKPTLEELLEYIKQVKVDAYKEFAKRLKARFYPDTRFSKPVNDAVEIFRNAIDDILEELTDCTFTKVDHSSLCETETFESR